MEKPGVVKLSYLMICRFYTGRKIGDSQKPRRLAIPLKWTFASRKMDASVKAKQDQTESLS